MSYYCTLCKKGTDEILRLPMKYMIYGANYKIGGTDECELSITYNYAPYFKEALEMNDKYADKLRSGGILSVLDGVSGLDSINILNDMINAIKSRYMANGEWLKTVKSVSVPFDKKTGVEILDISSPVDANWVKMDRVIDEGNTSNYWDATGANAVKALEGLLFFAKQRPDGVWRIY